jgi:hypothetical protein
MARSYPSKFIDRPLLHEDRQLYVVKALPIEALPATGTAMPPLVVPTYPAATPVLRVDRLGEEVAALLDEALLIVGPLVALTDHELRLTVANDLSAEVLVAAPDAASDDPVPNMEVEALVEIDLILEVILQATPDLVFLDHEVHANNLVHSPEKIHQ